MDRPAERPVERLPRIERGPAALGEQPASAAPIPSRPAPIVVESSTENGFEPLPSTSFEAAPPRPSAATARPARRPMPRPSAPGGPASENGAEGDDALLERGATAPQLRRFIKSRAYVPMHELRRRFAINGGDDEVTVVDLERRRVYVGLPEREGKLLGDLLRGGDIGYELSLDPITPIVVGVYPMRPVTRV